ncbi:hypothetical protein RFI_20985, partial [Reticulomyxa filosa]
MKKYDRVRDLIQLVAYEYKCKPDFILGFVSGDYQLKRDLEHNTTLAALYDCDDTDESYKLYILRDWNKEVTKEDIATKQLKLFVGRTAFASPIDKFLENFKNGAVNNSTRKINQRTGATTSLREGESPLFGLPFAFSFLNIH